MKKLLDMGMMATINQALDHDTATLVAAGVRVSGRERRH